MTSDSREARNRSPSRSSGNTSGAIRHRVAASGRPSSIFRHRSTANRGRAARTEDPSQKYFCQPADLAVGWPGFVREPATFARKSFARGHVTQSSALGLASCPHVRPLRSRISVRARDAGGSQYGHGSFGLLHAATRPGMSNSSRRVSLRAPKTDALFESTATRGGCQLRVAGAVTSEPEETVFVLRARAPARRGFRSA